MGGQERISSFLRLCALVSPSSWPRYRGAPRVSHCCSGLAVQPVSPHTLPASWLRPSVLCALPGQALGPAMCWVVDFLLPVPSGKGEGLCLGHPRTVGGWSELKPLTLFFKEMAKPSTDP